MMGKRATVVLLVLFFGGLGALWWARTAGVPTADERRAMQGRVLPQLLKVETEQITRIEIDDPSTGDQIALERRDDAWQIVSPINALADRRQAEGLLNNLKSLQASPEAGTLAGDPARFGLEPADRVIRVFRSGDQEPIATLALGDELERLRYVRAEGGPITLTDSLRVEPNAVDPQSWRERGLFEIYTYDVKAINVVGPGRRLNVVFDGGRWRIVHPFRAPANAEAINGLLADLAELEAIAGAEGFAAEDVEDLAPFGLDPENATIITLLPAGLTGSPEPQMAYLGSAPEGQDDLRFARRAGQDDVLVVRPRKVAELGLDPQAVRSRKVVDFRPSEVQGIQIEARGQTYQLAKGSDGWRVQSPSEGLADALDVATLLETLVALESAEFFRADEVGAERSGLDAPAATVSVWLDRPEPGDDDGPLFERSANASLKIGRFDAGRKLVYGQLERDEETVLALPGTVLTIVPDGRLALRDRTLVRQDPRTVRRIELTRGERSLTLERSASSGVGGAQGTWEVIEPTLAPADRLATMMLIEGLSRLRAERWVEDSDEPLASFGLEEPNLRVTWEGESGEPMTRTLEVGAVVPDRPEEAFARLDRESGVFTIGPKLLAVLTAEFRDRRLLAFPVEQAIRIAVQGSDAEVVFVRGNSGTWEPEAGADAWPEGYDADRVAALAASLAELTADQIVQDDGSMPEGRGLTDPELMIEVRLKEPEGVATVRLGSVVNGLRFAAMKAEGPGAVFLIKAEPFDLPVPRSGDRTDEQP
ncbi:DUF4340 domain-containing protein [Tautonia rosea]|uniref:DUF4340 domain-containing protein n=1 Tax=Tautonia rosea TaxID=2728037 RepID=UPI0014747EDE|nr:DUF4340 domain-containing protein [Tautonia rosea]